MELRSIATGLAESGSRVCKRVRIIEELPIEMPYWMMQWAKSTDVNGPTIGRQFLEWMCFSLTQQIAGECIATRHRFYFLAHRH